MKKPGVTAEQVIGTAMRILERLLGEHSGGILCAKAIETGIRLAARLCVYRLSLLSVSNAEVGRRVGVSRDTVASWASGEYTPDTEHFTALLKLYIDADNQWWEGRQKGTNFI